MLAHWRARGYAIEETRQGRTQKLRAHSAKKLPWNQGGQFPFQGVILSSGRFQIELVHFGDLLQERGRALLASRIVCRAQENVGERGKVLERLRCLHIR